MGLWNIPWLDQQLAKAPTNRPTPIGRSAPSANPILNTASTLAKHSVSVAYLRRQASTRSAPLVVPINPTTHDADAARGSCKSARAHPPSFISVLPTPYRGTFRRTSR